MPLVGLLAVLSDKDVDGLLSELADCFDSGVVTASSSNRSLEVASLAAVATQKLQARIESVAGFQDALERARTIAREIGGMVVVTGSISLVGDVLQILQEESDAE
jgi:dihydrofolate synthase/folylpolyglutamate synthase